MSAQVIQAFAVTFLVVVAFGEIRSMRLQMKRVADGLAELVALAKGGRR